MTMHKTITITVALSFTGLAVALAAASASTRAASPHAVALLASLSVAVVLAAHLAPALLRTVPKVVLWPTWALCLAGALYAHASFLAASGRDSAAAQLASSPAAAARASQRAEIEAALDSIKVRPTAQIARQISWTTDQSRAAALHIELAAAQRRDALHDQLVVLSTSTAAAAAGARADPVAGALASAMGVSPDALSLTIYLLLALVLELLGMLIWREVFSAVRKPDQAPESGMISALTAAPQAQAVLQTGMHQVVQVNVHPHAPAAAQTLHDTVQPGMQLFDTAPADDVAQLRSAIKRGLCQPTVASIRSYMGCGTTKATALRRAVTLHE